MSQRPLKPPLVAAIDEQACIGCTLCLAACPVDAIVGAARRMHTVIAAECTGCGWCLPPCPVDCIAMVESGGPLTGEERRCRATQYRRRYRARQARLEREQAERLAAEQRKAGERRKRETIARVMQRARERLRQRGER